MWFCCFMLFALALLFDMELLSAMLLVLFVLVLTAALKELTTVRTPRSVDDNSIDTTVSATTAATTATGLQCPAVVHGESEKHTTAMISTTILAMISTAIIAATATATAAFTATYWSCVHVHMYCNVVPAFACTRRCTYTCMHLLLGTPT